MFEFQFSSISDFLAMGGYGLYVWSSYAFFSVVVVYNLLQPKLVRKKFFKQQMASMQRSNMQKSNARKENT